jgi:predicted ATPase/DNA-binding SARP family transcriptional activator
VRLGILGELELIDDEGRSVALPVQLRRLTVMLAVAGGSGVSADRISEYLRGGRVEGSAVRTAVSRLRKHLVGRIETTKTGYRLVLTVDEFDLYQFEALLANPATMAAGERMQSLQDALRLWRGRALAEFADEVWAAATAVRLEELRTVATEDLAEEMVANSRSAEAVMLLDEHVVAHPYRERPVGLLIRALAASGRPTEAVRAFQRYRLALRDEVGTEPTAELRQLEADLLAAPTGDGVRSTPAARVRGNLPQPPDLFVGRVDERIRLANDVRARPLVTLTGPGGAGKTRLAVETGLALASEFPDGVWLVEFAPLKEPAAVVLTVASVLDVCSEERFTLMDSIAMAMRSQRAILIVDNCEHVRAEVCELVSILVSHCPDLRIIATSQQVLGVKAEHVHALAPLDDVEGCQLFCDRAQAADDRFTETDRSTVESICRQLDGMPLAIELAAARTRSLTPADILDHLDDRFRVLRRTRGRGDEHVDRHQTLFATVTWSYQLLDDAERLMFDRLSVFAGGFSLAAALSVCGAPSPNAIEVLDVLTSLVDKSIMVADVSGATVRYRLLETLRQYGQDQLRHRDDVDAVHRLHFEYYFAVAESFDAVGPTGGLPPSELVELEWDNFRAAIQWGIDNDQASRSGWMIGLIGSRIIRVRDEYQSWVRAALAALPEDHPVMANLCGAACHEASEFEEMLAFADRGLKNAPDSSVLQGFRALALRGLGHADQGLAAARRALALPNLELEHRETHLLHVACACAWTAEPTALPAFAGRLSAIAELSRHPYDLMVAAYADGLSQLVSSDPLEALVRFRRSRHMATAFPMLESLALLAIARAAVAAAVREAPSAIGECIAFSVRRRYWFNAWLAMELLAIHWVNDGRTEEASVLLGGIEAANIATVVTAIERRAAVDTVAARPELSALLHRGATMSRAELVAFALERLDPTHN